MKTAEAGLVGRSDCIDVNWPAQSPTDTVAGARDSISNGTPAVIVVCELIDDFAF
jgi:hypothetical protein